LTGDFRTIERAGFDFCFLGARAMKKKLLLVASGLVVTFAVFYVVMWEVARQKKIARIRSFNGYARVLYMESDYWTAAEKAEARRIWKEVDKE